VVGAHFVEVLAEVAFVEVWQLAAEVVSVVAAAEADSMVVGLAGAAAVDSVVAMAADKPN
jgi:hypothetical protein